MLARQRDFHRGVWFWTRLLALYAGLFFTGWEPLHHWHGNGNAPRAVNLLIVSVLAVFAVWVNYKRSRKIQQRIDALDDLKRADGAGDLP